MVAANSETFERFRLGLEDFEDRREAGDVEHFLDHLIEVADPQFSVGRLQLLGGGKEDAKPGAADVLELLEVHEDLLVAALDQLGQLRLGIGGGARIEAWPLGVMIQQAQRFEFRA